jgi:exopolysaccharide/PEP-CTERM locus tyrosine autokinase
VSESNHSSSPNRRFHKTSSVEKAAARLSDAAMLADAARPAGANGAGADHSQASHSKSVVIDLDAMHAAGMVTNTAERSAIAEEFRFVKRPLILRATAPRQPGARPGNLILVSSARPGEGKTFCAVNLAMSIALERDLTVMLIDADITKPSVPLVLGIEAQLGLTDLISDESLDVSDVLLRTNIDNLTVLPAGRQHHLATELLASDRMERLFEEVVKRYDDRIIIIDSPPVLMSSIAGVLALHVGQTVFVVQAERSTRASIDSALGLIGDCENIYLLLNKTRTIAGVDSFDGYYGYYR